jgi:hypothetical protein
MGFLSIHKGLETLTLEEMDEVEEFIMFLQIRSKPDSYKNLIYLLDMLDEKEIKILTQVIEEDLFTELEEYMDKNNYIIHD